MHRIIWKELPQAAASKDDEDDMTLIDRYSHFDNVSGTTQEIKLFIYDDMLFKKVISVFNTKWYSGNIT